MAFMCRFDEKSLFYGKGSTLGVLVQHASVFIDTARIARQLMISNGTPPGGISGRF